MPPGMAKVSVQKVRVDRMLRGMLISTSPASISTYLGTILHPRLARRARERFAAQGDDAVGGPWKPLAASTLEIKASMGFGGRGINVRTGHLRDSVINASPILGHNAYGQTLNFPGNWDRPDLFYRNLQAAGAINTFVARPVVGVSLENDVAHMLSSLQQWIIRGAGAVS